MSRATSEASLLLVGSLPAESTDEAFRAGAEHFGDLVFALPDGETGPRQIWTGYEHVTLIDPDPDVEVVERASSGIGRTPYDTPIVGLREGVDRLHWDRWPRIDDAIESYRRFAELRDAGTIPPDLRFQVSLPLTQNVINQFQINGAHDYPIAEAAYEEMLKRELGRLLEAVPADDLAVQWDVCFEVLDNEGVLAWTDDKAWERFTGEVRRLGPLLPDQVLMGYHLCYGTFPDWPMFEAHDMSLLVRMANFAVANSERRVDWFHLAGPRHLRSEDDRFFAPLKDLDVGSARVFLGIILPIDGIEGAKRRHATASRHLGDFGVAMYCGFGRQPGESPSDTIRQHRDAVLAVSQR